MGDSEDRLQSAFEPSFLASHVDDAQAAPCGVFFVLHRQNGIPIANVKPTLQKGLVDLRIVKRRWWDIGVLVYHHVHCTVHFASLLFKELLGQELDLHLSFLVEALSPIEVKAQ